MANDGYYYYYSEKQKKVRSAIDDHPTFFAKINGKVMECTERNTEKRPASAFDDYIYLGQGEYIGNKPS
ncbi:MAG: hypothetical protein A4E48_01746 [Methanosaeta sp. PtaU1.Bin060]|jgi:hypothetical protein|nr:MAG: hypothetical protein A4E48_01746 [Methanosaeta sp. PtaU1.Bin060]